MVNSAKLNLSKIYIIINKTELTDRWGNSDIRWYLILRKLNPSAGREIEVFCTFQGVKTLISGSNEVPFYLPGNSQNPIKSELKNKYWSIGKTWNHIKCNKETHSPRECTIVQTQPPTPSFVYLCTWLFYRNFMYFITTQHIGTLSSTVRYTSNYHFIYDCRAKQKTHNVSFKFLKIE